MLSELKINNFAIAESLDIELGHGLTTITGETGAGKSIMIDALSLALGARADSHAIGPNGDKSQIIASFDIRNNTAAQSWLSSKSLDTDDECILRRTLGKDGKSRAFINGVPSPLQDVKALAEHLINIHSQHQHQQLLKKNTHRELLDTFCEQQALSNQVQNCFKQWKDSQRELVELQENQSTRLARIDFLAFQLDELDKLALAENEYQSLNDEHKKLANADQTIEQANEALRWLSASEGVNAASEAVSVSESLSQVQTIMQKLANHHQELLPSLDGIKQALIQVDESSSDLQHFLDALDLDPEKLSQLDLRLSKVHTIARKHNIPATELFTFHQTLQEELDKLQNSDTSLAQLEINCQEQRQAFIELANKLSKKRKQGSSKLDKLINLKFSELGMSNARIETQLRDINIDDARAYGLDDIEICVSTNLGQQPQSLSKIASGGELSRISLAIQVSFAEKNSIPSLIFDEVDVGIGGATAEVVGRLLKELSAHGQVICVTHLAQVAAQGKHHLKVQKNSLSEAGKVSVTEVCALSEKQRVEEISRMLGGVELTQKTQSYAKEMLAMAKAS